jgi:acetolactate synthase small subunit
MQTFNISAKAENGLLVLQKLASLLSRKRLKVLEINVSESSGFGTSQLMLVLQTEAREANWLIKQLRKVVDLSELQLSSPDDGSHKFGDLYPHYHGYALF